MNIKDFITYLFPKTLEFRLAYHGLIRMPLPVTLTFSVTNKCQSRCKTCNIWKLYPEKHQNPAQELSLDEITRFFKSMGRVYFFNLSGGEPFLRKDLPDIVASAIDYLHPSIIHSPTNGLAPDRIIETTRQILQLTRQKKSKAVVTVKPSLDGIGPLHDEIRGVKGNWVKLLKTVDGLKALENEFGNFHLEVGTVISNFNKNHLDGIENYVHRMGIQSYRSEVAEQREEFCNIGDPITPSAEEYIDLIHGFAAKIKKNLKQKKSFTKTTEALRLVYYDLAAKIMMEDRQVIPCYAGISNIHLTPHGDVWPCCVLGYKKPFGNIRNQGYDFHRVVNTPEAVTIKASIKNRECACPLANQAYSNIISHVPSLIRTVKNMFLHFKL